MFPITPLPLPSTSRALPSTSRALPGTSRALPGTAWASASVPPRSRRRLPALKFAALGLALGFAFFVPPPARGQDAATASDSGESRGQTVASDPSKSDTKDTVANGVEKSAEPKTSPKSNPSQCRNLGEPMVGQWQSCQFGGEGPVQIDDDSITLGIGDPLTGVSWTGEMPTENYRFSFEAQRIEGFDFFAAATFPIGDGFATFVPGGWGGGVVGLSSINGYDASENETTQYRPLKDNTWYCFAVEVRPDTVKAFIDQSEVFSVAREDKKFSLRAEMDLCKPIGIAAFQGDAVIRNVRLTKLPVVSKTPSTASAPAVSD